MSPFELRQVDQAIARYLGWAAVTFREDHRDATIREPILTGLEHLTDDRLREVPGFTTDPDQTLRLIEVMATKPREPRALNISVHLTTAGLSYETRWSLWGRDGHDHETTGVGLTLAESVGRAFIAGAPYLEWEFA